MKVQVSERCGLFLKLDGHCGLLPDAAADVGHRGGAISWLRILPSTEGDGRSCVERLHAHRERPICLAYSRGLFLKLDGAVAVCCPTIRAQMKLHSRRRA